ncbi:MAG: hypothetical protein JXQ65_01295 [Candidatus Marinimicrobia bacterium]|nr:hypothetical protein [Candidatus Neomarinimicrobiota bacterium]
MITIVTGKINSGKTRYLQNLYENTPKGDGFITLKHFEKDPIIRDETFLGYNIFHLKTGTTVPFIRIRSHFPAGWNEIFKFGIYSFSREGFEFAKIIYQNIEEEPFFIDEVGPLEIELNSGFYEIIKQNINKELIITIRTHLYEEFLKTFPIEQKINKIIL